MTRLGMAEAEQGVIQVELQYRHHPFSTYFQRYLHFAAFCYLPRNVVNFCRNLVFLSFELSEAGNLADFRISPGQITCFI